MHFLILCFFLYFRTFSWLPRYSHLTSFSSITHAVGGLPCIQALGEESLRICDGPCHALEGPLQDPVPGALRISQHCQSLCPSRLQTPLYCPGSPCLAYIPTSVTLWVTPHMWSPLDGFCLVLFPRPPYLTQERVQLVPAQHGFTAEGDVLCLWEKTCPASVPAWPLPAALCLWAGY